MTSLRRGLAAVILCLAVCPAVAAQGAKSVFVEDLTWTELRDEIRAGRTTVIVPVGGTEQSGPHIALGKHNARARALAARIAAALGNALVAPVIAGRTTGMPSRSAWNCISRSFTAAPPSTRSSLTGAAPAATASRLIACSSAALW